MDNTLKDLILENDIISFDMFDTLVTRIIDDPENVFSILEKEFDIPSFRIIRHDKQAELGIKLTNEKGYPHANLDEIYDYISETTNIKNTNEIMKREMEIEKDLLFQNPQMYEMYKFAKKNKKKVVVTSDMYMLIDDIKEILNNCGYNDVDYIYLSSKERKAKFNGELFDLLIKESKGKKILHIGDNLKDDYEIPIEKGINAYRYTNSLINKNQNLTISMHNGIARLIKLSNDNFFEGIGAKAGLLYYGLYKKLLDYKKDKIYFLSRDGYNMYNLLKKYNKNIKTEYIYVSRRSMLLASIDEINEETIKVLPPFTLGQTVEEILEYISIKNIIELGDIKGIGFNSFSDRIKTIEDIDKFKKLYFNKEKQILNEFSKERKSAKKYFDSFNFDKETLFFDCGWNGSSQYLLENLFSKIGINTKVKFFYNGIFDNEKSRRQLKNKNVETYLFGFDNTELASKTLVDNIVMMELFFSAPHNSVLKYDDKKGYLLENLESDFKYKEDIYKGLEKYFEYISYFNKYNLEITSKEALEPVIEFIKNPTDEEAKKVGNISCVDGFANQKGETKYIAKVTKEQIEKNPNIEVYWQYGLLKRDDIDDEVKQIVRDRFGLNEIIQENVVSRRNYIGRLKNAVRVNGLKTTIYKIKRKIINKISSIDDYQLWIKLNEKDILKTEKLDYNPKFSIVMPVYNAIKEELIEAIESVLNQTYQNFEICIVDDASTSTDTLEILKKYESNEKIKISYHKKNAHISQTTNDGFKMADGEFISLLDNDDVLAPNALYEVAKLLNKNKKLDFIYSDEDKLTEDGKYRHEPFFKPDWSPDTFMSLMYTNHFSTFRKAIVDEIGGETVGLEGAQDYDFVMRFTERTNNIGHISKILYHWRERVGSIANDPEAKPYALTAIENLKKDSFKRKNIQASIEYNKMVYQYRVNYIPKDNSVTIISYGDKNELNIINKKVKEIIYIDKLDDYIKIKDKIKTDILLFMNSNVRIKTKNYIELLCGHASQKHIGLVGCKYLSNNIISNSGLTTYFGNNVLSKIDDNIPQYYCRNILDYNCYSVSNELFAIRKELFDKYYKYSNDEITLGKKLLEEGLYNVVRNDVVVEKQNNSDNKFLISEYDPYINNNLLHNSFKVDTYYNNYKFKVKRINNSFNYNSKETINYNIECYKKDNYLVFNGYIYDKTMRKNNYNKISILLIGNNNCYEINSKQIFDVYPSEIYHENLNFTNFYTNINIDKLNENYKVYIRIKNNITRVNKVYDIDEIITRRYIHE